MRRLVCIEGDSWRVNTNRNREGFVVCRNGQNIFDGFRVVPPRLKASFAGALSIDVTFENSLLRDEEDGKGRMVLGKLNAEAIPACRSAGVALWLRSHWLPRAVIELRIRPTRVVARMIAPAIRELDDAGREAADAGLRKCD